jgi:hypothetical protein
MPVSMYGAAPATIAKMPHGTGRVFRAILPASAAKPLGITAPR